MLPSTRSVPLPTLALKVALIEGGRSRTTSDLLGRSGTNAAETGGAASDAPAVNVQTGFWPVQPDLQPANL